MRTVVLADFHVQPDTSGRQEETGASEVPMLLWQGLPAHFWAESFGCKGGKTKAEVAPACLPASVRRTHRES